MERDLKRLLSHMLWIGGAPDSGKTTAARRLAERYQWQTYHYDQHDRAHHEQLAKTRPEYRLFLDASLEDRWITPDPEALYQRMLRSFHDRFPLLIEDLLGLPGEPKIVVEGFGLLPELLAPLLHFPSQALWLVPTEAFKLASLERRNKPSWGRGVSDPERGRMNLIQRDQL